MTATPTARRASHLDAEWDRLCSQARAAGVSTDNLLAIQVLPTDVLVQAAGGGLDLNALARAALAARGLDAAGNWIGFDAAGAALVGKFAAAVA